MFIFKIAMAICLPVLWIFVGIFAAVQGSPQLLLVNGQDIQLVHLKSAVPLTIIENLSDAAGVDFLYSDGLFFWTDITNKSIQRASIGQAQQTSTTLISSNLLYPEGIACDWIGKNIYWTDFERNVIEVSNIDGKHRKVLYRHNTDHPRAICVHPLKGLVFWTDVGEHPKIERAGMDGDLSTRSVILDENIYWPNALTLDIDDLKLYFADANLNYIHSCDFDGNHRQVIIDNYLPHPFAMTVLGDTLYWTDWSTKAIHTCNKHTGKSSILLDDIYSPMDIVAFDAGRQPTGKNPCTYDNGGCSHLCLISPNKPFYKCACPTGVVLRDYNRICADGFEKMLVFARITDLRMMSLDMPDADDIVLPIKPVRHAVAIDYDPVEGHMYWTDDQVRRIQRAYLNGSGVQVVVKEVDQPDGIVVDWFGRNLYWTDAGTDRIEMARLDGTSRRVVISDKLDEPRAICLSNGFMYWTDWGANPKIERALMDGSQREVLISTGLKWPNGLAVDDAENKIYWCDAGMDKIEVANRDGSDRKVLVESNIQHPFGFSLLDDYIYWSDWRTRSIQKVNKTTGGDRTTVIHTLPDLMGIKAVNSKVNFTAYSDKNSTTVRLPCLSIAGCSHNCIPVPDDSMMVSGNKWKCMCQNDYWLNDDKRTCSKETELLLIGSYNQLFKFSLRNETTNLKEEILADGLQYMDYDPLDDHLYWIGYGQTSGFIKRTNLKRTDTVTIKTFVGKRRYIPDIAVDWVGRNLYWIDPRHDRIEAARLDGSSSKVIVHGQHHNPTSICIDTQRRYLWWTDGGLKPGIRRAWLDGSHDMPIITAEDPRSIAIDVEENTIYWMTNGRIEFSNADGTERKVLASVSRSSILNILGNYVYWLDSEKDLVKRVDKSTGKNEKIIVSKIPHNSISLKVISREHQNEDRTGCPGENGGCSHLCFVLPDDNSTSITYKCACSTQYMLDSENGTCSEPQSSILITTGKNVRRIVVNDSQPDQWQVDVVLSNMKSNSVVFDSIKGYIYWIGNKSIKRSKMDGEMEETMVTGMDLVVFDIAMDPFSKLLFWSCLKHNLVNVTRTDKRTAWTVIQSNEEKPRHLAVNPYTGHLYWTNTAKPVTIVRTRYNGKESKTIIRVGLVEPASITVDGRSNRLFWIETNTNTIECSDLSGGNRKQLLFKEPKYVIRGLTVMGRYIYFGVKRSRPRYIYEIRRIRKKTGENETVIKYGSPVSDLEAAVFLDSTKITHPCANTIANCSHICYTETDSSAQCSCPSKWILSSDGQTCREMLKCGPDTSACEAGDMCIPIVWKCDGFTECSDSSDEKNCPFRCKMFPFLFIPVNATCDGISDCPDNSDETNCTTCSNEGFNCGDNICISTMKLCDGENDCFDGSDEKSCSKCSPTAFQCKSKIQCIPLSGKCDGKRQCTDNSDERDCTKQTSSSCSPFGRLLFHWSCYEKMVSQKRFPES